MGVGGRPPSDACAATVGSAGTGARDAARRYGPFRPMQGLRLHKFPCKSGIGERGGTEAAMAGRKGKPPPLVVEDLSQDALLRVCVRLEGVRLVRSPAVGTRSRPDPGAD
jgi:hypothetical protein